VEITPPITCPPRRRPSNGAPGAEIPVLWLASDQDGGTTGDLASALADAIADAMALDEPSVVLDLSGVHSISAATIRVMMAAKKQLADHGCSLVLHGPPPFVRKVFDVCGLSDLLDADSSAGRTPDHGWR